MNDDEHTPGDSNPHTAASRPPKPGLNAGRFSRLALKELREILRDRRTIITLVVMPLLVYPMLSLVLQRVLLNSDTLNPESSTQTTFLIATEDQEQRDLFINAYLTTAKYQSEHNKLLAAVGKKENGKEKQNEKENLRESADSPSTVGEVFDPEAVDLNFFVDGIYFGKVSKGFIETAQNGGMTTGPGIEPGRTLEQRVADGEVDIGVRVKRNEFRSPIFSFGSGAEIEIVYRQGSATSEQAVLFLSDLFRFGNEMNLKNRLIIARVPSTALIDQKITAIKSAPVKRTHTLATLIPLILTLMTITGAVYPAIDLTAGERERGTLETLIAAPIPRMGILLGKFIAVFTVAQLTALVNMIGMMITIWAFQLDKLFFDDGITLGMVAQIMGLVALFAGFFSAILLAITSFARSFKEAQAYLIPVMLVSMTPGLGALMPGLKLEGIWVVLPLINMVLLARDILQDEATLPVAIIAISATAIYGALALAFAARIFGTDSVLFDNQRGWRHGLRRPKTASETVSVPGAFLCLALLFPANFLWLGLLNRVGGSPTLRLELMIAGTFFMFALFPILVAYLGRVRFGSGLGLRGGRLISYPAAILLGCSLGVLLIQIYSSVDLISDFFVDSQYETNESRKKLVQAAEQQVESWRRIPAPLVLTALSIIPAVCEELFFRGLILHSLLKRTHMVFAVIVSGLLFGLFHILSTNLLALERFLPTALMGMVLAIVCIQSRSVIPGMILHTLHNLILVSTALYNNWLIENRWISPEQESLPLPLVISAVVVSGIGFVMLFIGATKSAPHQDESEE